MNMSIVSKLRTIQPGDVLCLSATPEEIERLWYSEVSYDDRSDFELLIEPHGAKSCLVSIEHRKELGDGWWWVLPALFIGIGIALLCQIS